MISRIGALSFVLVAASLTGACSSSSSSGPSKNAAAEQACLDTADAAAKALERCGAKYDEAYKTFISAAAKGDCANTIGVRDEDALRKRCLPFFAKVECSKLTAGDMDESCKAQLQHPASFQADLVAPSSVGAAMTGVAEESAPSP